MSCPERENGGIAWMLLPALLLAGGLAGWLLFLDGAETGRAWRAFLVNFLFFTSLAGGLVTWSAVVLASNGAWAGHLERFALMGTGFALPSLLALALLWLGSADWSPWHGRSFDQGLWLTPGFLFGRDLLSLLLFWGLALFYAHRRRRGEGQTLAGWLVFTYCLVWSLLGFDLVMALEPHGFSALAGGYFFISGLYIAAAAWALAAALHPKALPERRHDLGKLVFAFSILTTYMLYSQLLPIWYENLPHESVYLLPRFLPPWQEVSTFLLALVYLGPLALLLTVRAKRSRLWLGGVALLLLIGLWIERWWLVAPAFAAGPRWGVVEASATAAFLGAALLSLGWGWRRAVSGGIETGGHG